MTLTDLIKACQLAVKVEADGKAGPATWNAISKALGIPTSTSAIPMVSATVTLDRVDERSEKNIATLLSHVQPYARALVHRCAAQGITIKVISGTRTIAEQNILFNQAHDGKDNNGNGKVDEASERVTKARGGYSNHNFGFAWDIGVFVDGKYVPESPIYKAVGAIGTDLGLEWGGNWKSIVDEPHFQLRPSWAKHLSERDMLAELRNGRPIA